MVGIGPDCRGTAIDLYNPSHNQNTTPHTHMHTQNSPVNDLLDRGDFTLTEILDEDDVLQEIKSMNTRLVDLCVGIYI